MFRDRTEAGAMLATKLERYAGAEAVVVALPRGGVVTGFEVAQALTLSLDIIAVRKVGHPSDPEYAVGAVDEFGTTLYNEREVKTLKQAWLEEETQRQKREAQRRSALYRGGRAPVSLGGKTVLIVDDGVATGLTARLAVRAALGQGSKKVVVATPVASQSAVRALKKEGAEVEVLEPPAEFVGAVGAHYQHFEQVSDEEVVALLQRAAGGVVA